MASARPPTDDRRFPGCQAAIFGEWAPAYQSFAKQALLRLPDLNRANVLADLTHRRGSRLEALSGDRAGQRSIRINRQWRICFRWDDGDAYDVEIVDYH